MLRRTTVALPVALLTLASARPTLFLDNSTRLLVVAPHPDDEAIAAAGTIRRVTAAGGVVRVVYLTDGEAYTAGVQAVEGRNDSPKPEEYFDYGEKRKHEARRALATLGVKDDSALIFLGFPNNGLSRMMTRYWSDRRPPFRSPYTRRDRPRPSEKLDAQTKFSGEDLTQELAEVIGAMAPTMILTPRKEDQHADHCAAWYFVADALTDVTRVKPDYEVDLLTYIVHYYSWPFEDDAAPRLPTPAGLSGGISGWLDVPLTAAEQRAKRMALHEYKTQMLVMGWFLDGFARRNELFARVHVPPLALPLKRSPCEALAEPVPSKL